VINPYRLDICGTYIHFSVPTLGLAAHSRYSPVACRPFGALETFDILLSFLLLHLIVAISDLAFSHSTLYASPPTTILHTMVSLSAVAAAASPLCRDR